MIEVHTDRNRKSSSDLQMLTPVFAGLRTAQRCDAGGMQPRTVVVGAALINVLPVERLRLLYPKSRGGAAVVDSFFLGQHRERTNFPTVRSVDTVDVGRADGDGCECTTNEIGVRVWAGGKRGNQGRRTVTTQPVVIDADVEFITGHCAKVVSSTGGFAGAVVVGVERFVTEHGFSKGDERGRTT